MFNLGMREAIKAFGEMVNRFKKKKKKKKKTRKRKKRNYKKKPKIKKKKDKAKPFPPAFSWKRNLGCKSRPRYSRPGKPWLVTHFREGPASFLPALLVLQVRCTSCILWKATGERWKRREKTEQEKTK